MNNPATSWFEIANIPMVTFTNTNGETETIFYKNYVQMFQIIKKLWFIQYPQPVQVVHNNGSEFKLHFETLCDTYGLKRNPTTIKNLQENALLEIIHAVLGNMLCTSQMESTDVMSGNIDNFITDEAYTVCATHHTVLGYTPTADIFDRDLLFNISYIADWKLIR